MDDIKVKDFIKTKTIKVCYIYAVELNDDETIKKVAYYRYDEEEKKFVDRNWDVQSFANQLVKGNWIAYAGKITGTGDEQKMNNPSLVTVKTIDGNLYLTTASDEEDSNNLAKLPKFKS